MQKRALVCGGGGFIGNHLIRFLKSKNYLVIGVDLNLPKFSKSSPADVFITGDLRDPLKVREVFNEPIDEVYQMATDMGGAGYLFTGNNDAKVMHDSTLINLNVLNEASNRGVKKIFYPSSACVYPEHNLNDAQKADCPEQSVYPANPSSEYGWEKLFGERLYMSYMRNYGIRVKIARFHTIYGPETIYSGGREKVPAALARKVAKATDGDAIEIWGDGEQTRTFLYIDDCLEAVYKLMQSEDFHGPVNIGSDQLISINELAHRYISLSGKQLTLNHVEGPQGVRGRNSSNELITSKLQWQPSTPLDEGLKNTYDWVSAQIQGANESTDVN